MLTDGFCPQDYLLAIIPPPYPLWCSKSFLFQLREGWTQLKVFSWLGARTLWAKERTQEQRQHLKLGRVHYPSGWNQGPRTEEEEETRELRPHCIAGPVLCLQHWIRTSGLGVRNQDERNALETVLVSLVIVRWNFIQRGSVDFIQPPAMIAALIISSNLWTKFGKT